MYKHGLFVYLIVLPEVSGTIETSCFKEKPIVYYTQSISRATLNELQRPESRLH